LNRLVYHSYYFFFKFGHKSNDINCFFYFLGVLLNFQLVFLDGLKSPLGLVVGEEDRLAIVAPLNDIGRYARNGKPWLARYLRVILGQSYCEDRAYQGPYSWNILTLLLSKTTGSRKLG